MNKVTHFDTPELLATVAANYFAKLASECIKRKGKFIVALSGGSTPSSMYALLASPAYKKMDWKNIYIFWGDERCVALDSNENNAFNAKSILLDKVPIPKKNIFLIPVDETPTNAAIYYEATIKIFFKTDKPVFDLILLGMGDEGHTASLFPYTTILQEKNKLVSEVFLTDKSVWRVSLTEPIINLAAHKLFLIAGKTKVPMVDIILNGEKNIEKYPAQMIDNAEWFVNTK